MLLGLSLFYVGAVLVLNGIWLHGRIADNEIWVINVFSGIIACMVSFKLAFGVDADAESIKAAALTFLFGFTYFWIAINRFNKSDGKGLGWFSLFVAITAVPVALDTLMNASSIWQVWFGLSWVAWSFLWFLFFLLLALQKPIVKLTGTVATSVGVLTGWLPGYLLLDGVLK
ncbi:AmiS/UreI family transporter [Granulosicoccus antarcticus]|uniref:Acid-activated urea channel n=1 Tax=Granulosicoccus antarcticus IMCC3135 TaxID=1192854 RepID=A0A2Z2NSC0_9GAMM|nr:AmiS/UreI family transporter [Granulosicoccus antarcticus]ASJ74213.1 Acid-activated urea channel [Granulosicoccus antarcticus IMCC3135]